MTELGKVAPPNSEWRSSLFARSSGSRFLSSGFRRTKTARSSKENRYSLFGGATFPNSELTGRSYLPTSLRKGESIRRPHLRARILSSLTIFTRSEGIFTRNEGIFTRSEGIFTRSEGIFTRSEGIFTHSEGERISEEGRGR
eukprot:1192787-Prorocentrum_minimum.AAC.2